MGKAITMGLLILAPSFVVGAAHAQEAADAPPLRISGEVRFTADFDLGPFTGRNDTLQARSATLRTRAPRAARRASSSTHGVPGTRCATPTLAAYSR